MDGPPMNNSGTGKLQVPGFGDLRVYHEVDPRRPLRSCCRSERDVTQSSEDTEDNHRFDIALAQFCYGYRLTICEVYMLRLMELVTEKPNWEHNVFDEHLVAQWYTEFCDLKMQSQSKPDSEVDMDLVSPRAWE
ncbi:hypothetical protein BO94DRAFT_542061 [Aspergillus sclerotioniger CBS 115572]|uniref:DUF4246 domain-containing protein n=1 Tax=Aspergillus sclerotioniger CBS 115572 TaxID=1450535 RepID=A0A317XFR8_9EURO|nr:hypothetical protein BO94DRAFT_542061 [Aspergillus sclerotioniger CBS 115572]PWY95978.1 hypothetical protein BO94DRAFT_542061 [Aspergillus sclerotioniger CBS 115572]